MNVVQIHRCTIEGIMALSLCHACYVCISIFNKKKVSAFEKNLRMLSAYGYVELSYASLRELVKVGD